MRARVADERGFTLIELLVTTALGIGVLLAGFGLLDAGGKSTSRIQDRSAITERGRLALEQTTRLLRSQVCLGLNSPAITQADGNSVTFYSDLSKAYVGSDPTKIFTPQRTQLAFSGGTLTENTYVGTGTAPNLSFPATPTRTRVLLSGAAQVGTSPFFRYYAFTTTGTATPTRELATPLSSGDAAQVVQIGVSFRVLPDSIHSGQSLATDFVSQVYVRTAVATDPNHSPQCS